MKAPVSMRIFFAFMSAMLWTGIYFTGFSVVNWLLYLPAAVSLFAAITGICPSLMVITKLMDLNQKQASIK
ncbi:DUF2892 domain-containing protein [Rhodocytophaga rosea]|uniref:DUF2892 domain-containing protein n=1 Tax=Rhodocytophaga rosea TaxID=2704465 RepID=A0A6C0GPZ8_9BACT|nr:YgaP-like transmembrane domain [Rhodocytophaga rosea]QHT69662.1 DUF2892 domain-containing protein [Rhodocytophaga rosea]